MRASDADREAVAERLRGAAAEGRLDADELEERLDVALRARTYGELDGLLRDLPGPDVARRRHGRPPLVTALLVGGGAVAVLIAIALVVAFLAITAAWWLVWVVLGFALCGRRRHRAPRHRAVYRVRCHGYSCHGRRSMRRASHLI